MLDDWPSDVLIETDRLQVERDAALAQLEITQESLADIQLALEDTGWTAMAIRSADEFTRDGRRRAAGLCRILATQNPLVKRGIAIRTGYIWGDGVQISAAEAEVNDVIQAFNDDNKTSFSSSQAREESEKTVSTDGNVFRALPTSPLTGRVRVRSIDPDEIQEIICNPEDRDEPWFYLREYSANAAGDRYAGITKPTRVTKRILYPALGFRPTARMKQIDGIDVAWDTPVQHIRVNRIGSALFGIGDAYAAIAWARAYKEFLEDWAKLTKSLSRIAWRTSADRKGKAQDAAAKIGAANYVPPPRGTAESQAGATAAMGPGQTLEAIPKSGATIDSESGKPLAGMVAAAFGVPVTMLLSDPGQTGARAVAETLDAPTKNEMTLRRTLWADKDRELFDYVIDQAVKAPRGPLKGSVQIDEYGRELITLSGGMDRTISIDWPALDEVPIDVLMKAIATADETDKIPPLLIIRWVLMAMNEKDIDEVLAKLTDDKGDYIDPEFTAGTVAARNFRDGNDPAAALT